MRVLFDTNVFISAILFGGLPRELLEWAIRGRLRLVTSAALLAEFEDVLAEKFGFPLGAAGAIVNELDALAEIHDPVSIPSLLPDRMDNVVLATAAMARTEAIITGDRELLGLGSYEGIPIIVPRQFHQMIEGKQP